VLSHITEGSLGRWHFSAARIGVAMAILFCATGCLHHHKPTAPSAHRVPPPAAPIVQEEEGIASWYGHPYHGRQAASGEIYNMYAMTAAHRTLPFGTQVRVHDLENGRDVDVRINDRGPFVEGRIIDLSYAAAQAMGMPGVAQVRLEILGLGSSSEPAVFAVQVGAFRDPANAERLKARIEASFGPVVILSFDRGDGLFYRVRVGHESSEDAARALAEKLRSANLATATFVVRVN
jgi:rare lipoprotein A